MICTNCAAPMIKVSSKVGEFHHTCLRCGFSSEIEIGLSEGGGHALKGCNLYKELLFDEARECFDLAEFENTDDACACDWARLLCEYGAVYCKSEDGGFTPTIWSFANHSDITNNPIFREIISRAATDETLLRHYRESGEAISGVLNQIRLLGESSPRYDLFICFKETDDGATPTPERLFCDFLYKKLTERHGMSVFYAPETMRRMRVNDFEGYIHCALKNSRAMLVVAASAAHIMSPWVRSEWKRFLLANPNNVGNMFICPISSMSYEKFPPELKNIQSDLRADSPSAETAGDIAASIYMKILVKPNAPVAPEPPLYVPRETPRFSPAPVRAQIAAGKRHAFALLKNGSVVCAGPFDKELSRVNAWKNITAIAAGNGHAIGLRSDGTVVACGMNSDKQCEVSRWENIVAVSARGNYSIGLRADGSVVSTPACPSREEVSGLSDITAIFAGERHIVALKSDGGVVVVGKYSNSGDISRWKGIVSIASRGGDIIGLRSDGTLECEFSYISGGAVSEARDIVAISASDTHALLLRRGGGVLIADTMSATRKIASWENIVAVAAGHGFSLGLKRDGAIVFDGDDSYGQGAITETRGAGSPDFSEKF